MVGEQCNHLAVIERFRGRERPADLRIRRYGTRNVAE